MAKYGEKDGVKNYYRVHNVQNTLKLGELCIKVEFWSYQYDFSFQFWGDDSNNVFISRDNVEITSFGSYQTVQALLKKVVEWCEKANPSVKYPASIKFGS